ncbi:SDR family NAD(P)-dependent oxidoreductase [Ferrimonas senticii]|uniref:SDR family NAD(P)-dependent oxidoreductase n=1 Tax=Ferrimonas senticii TaxID=394566 RepID=UPI001969B395
MSQSQPLVLISGANRGLGKETAKQLAELGYRVLLSARSLVAAEQAVSELGLSKLSRCSWILPTATALRRCWI